jgi:hypothetical protein
MRQAFNLQPDLDTIPIALVELNLNCRHEMVPILRALQHLYEQPGLLQPILDAIGKDVTGKASARHGRPGMCYWEILVLAAVRQGCNCDYDELQNLAENHRTLRQIMGIDGINGPLHLEWRKIEDNITKLTPETLYRINQAIVGEGHRLVPDAPESGRIDSFVVETTSHYPTDSSLLGDGLRDPQAVGQAVT